MNKLISYSDILAYFYTKTLAGKLTQVKKIKGKELNKYKEKLLYSLKKKGV